MDAFVLRPRGDEGLRFVQREVRGDGADVFRRVGVAEHHLEAAARGIQPFGELGVLDDLAHDRRGGLQVGERLEQRDDVEHRHRAAGARSEAGELVHGGEVGGGLGERDDVAPRGAGAATPLIRPTFCWAAGRALWVAYQAMNRLMAKNATASHLVLLDRKLDAPREPNTVPEAPAPKPEPACAPEPRCISTSPMMAMATST